jgi:hypothetical protein
VLALKLGRSVSPFGRSGVVCGAQQADVLRARLATSGKGHAVFEVQEAPLAATAPLCVDIGALSTVALEHLAADAGGDVARPGGLARDYSPRGE